ncbi:Phosphorylated carbohydrates phosphatase [Streptococcus parauberis]|uniref:HAD family hydrolase n=1 Tax=Streptococcus parauberis TaxID=1348 RepID=UPI000CCE18F1|nr:HAD family hydrolase [Streptococcus parauberis]PNY20872.1 Phosphorylated carbohydrates phosphatase [Streptococcus parauberis]
MKEFIIFDMDGVIVDSEYTFLGSKTQMLLDRGIDTDESYQYQFMGTTFEFMWQKMKSECQLDDSVETLINEMNDRREEMISRDGVKAIQHTPEFIKYLHEKGYPLAVASSSPRQDIERNLKALKLDHVFDVLVSGEEVEHSKPSPDVFVKAAQLLGAPVEACIVFEDTKNGSLAAKAAGMTCVGFANPGYPKQDLSACDKLISSFKEAYEMF